MNNQDKNSNIKSQTTKAELVKEKSIRLPSRPHLLFYEAFLIYADGSRTSLGTMVGHVGESMIGSAFKRAYLLESDPTNVKKVKIERTRR